LHGYGVFALETINKNKRIIDYAGELISNKQSESREDKYLSKGCIWVFRVNRNWSRDAAVGGNNARFINHQCDPNCTSVIEDSRVWIETIRAVKKGEELGYNYEIGREKKRMRARAATAEEKRRYWPALVKMYPDYDMYQQRTAREIPVVILTPA